MRSAVALLLCALAASCAAGPENESFVFALVADPQIGMVEAARDREQFARVAASVNRMQGPNRPAFVMIAGDLVHDAANESLREAFDSVKSTFQMPVHVIPGNHDVPDGKFAGTDRFSFEYGGRLFIGLNGNLWSGPQNRAQEQFDWLARLLLARSRPRQVFIVQHQPLYVFNPLEKDEYFNTPSSWRADLLRLFERSKVTALLFGHLHRNSSGNYRGVPFLTTPSPCKNFDGSPLGYRLVQVIPDGFQETYVEAR